MTNDYDSLLRRTSARVATYASTLNSYTYDAANRLATVGDGSNTATYSYVTNSPLIAQVLSKQGSSPRLTSDRSYDLLDRLYAMNSVPTGGNMRSFFFGYGYNLLNQRVTAGAVDDGYWKNAYDWRGQLTNSRTTFWSRANSISTRATISAIANRLWAATVMGKAFARPLNKVYTPAGRWASRVWARGITTTYTYDNAGDLYSINYSDGVTAGVTNSYDRLGRLWTVAHNGTTTTKAYNGASELLSESYAGGTLGGLR